MHNRVAAALRPLLSWGTVLSGILSLLIWALFWDWATALLIVALIYMHELGHVLAAQWRGVPILHAPFFLPGFGAAVLTRRKEGESVWDAVWVVLGGPLLGLLAAFAVNRVGVWVGNPVVVAAGFMALVINLLNLLPVGPLDGGRVAAHSGWFGAGALALVTVGLMARPNLALWVPAVVAGITGYLLWRLWRNPPETSWRQQLGVLALYLGTILFGFVLGVFSQHLPIRPTRAIDLPALRSVANALFYYYLAAFVAVRYAAGPRVDPRLRAVVLALFIWPMALFTQPWAGLVHGAVAASLVGLPGLSWLEGLARRLRHSSPTGAGVAATEGYFYLMATGQPAEAAAHLDRMTAALADSPQALATAVGQMAARQYPEVAVAVYEAHLAAWREQPPLLLNNVAWAYLQAGQAERGLELARGAVAAEPANSACLDTLGNILLSLGEPGEAEQHLRASIALTPRPISRWGLAQALAAQGRHEEATAVAELVLRGEWTPDLPARGQVEEAVFRWRSAPAQSLLSPALVQREGAGVPE